MADVFRVRIVARPDANRKDAFKGLVEILSNAAENCEMNLEDLCDGFRSRDFAVAPENIIAEEDLVAFDAEVSYGIFEEGKMDFMSDWGIGELRMLFAYERPELTDWEDNDEDYKTIGLLKVKNIWIQEDGDWTVDDRDVVYEYPPEDDPVKIAQWWLLVWAGIQPSGYDADRFFDQIDGDTAEKAKHGITLLEHNGDTDGTPLWNYPEKVVGFKPLDSDTKFFGDRKYWWRTEV